MVSIPLRENLTAKSANIYKLIKLKELTNFWVLFFPSNSWGLDIYMASGNCQHPLIHMLYCCCLGVGLPARSLPLQYITYVLSPMPMPVNFILGLRILTVLEATLFFFSVMLFWAQKPILWSQLCYHFQLGGEFLQHFQVRRFEVQQGNIPSKFSPLTYLGFYRPLPPGVTQWVWGLQDAAVLFKGSFHHLILLFQFPLFFSRAKSQFYLLLGKIRLGQQVLFPIFVLPFTTP